MRGFVLFFFVPVLALAQGPGASSGKKDVMHYVKLYSAADQQVITSPAELPAFIDKLESKRDNFKRDKSFVSYLFTKTHQKYLRHYTSYCSFSDLLNEGTYNCLTGTALYALLLDHFNIAYRIIETNYHIFLIAETKEGSILLEATDPANGFVDNDTEIQKRIATYRANILQRPVASKHYYNFNFDLYNEVTLDQVLGLLYYNYAIVTYNKQELVPTISYLDKAVTLYHSARVEEFSRIVLLSVLESNLDNTVKENYVRKLQAIRKRQVDVVAHASVH
jgi:hypothetical protein